jgi:molecular chaperone HtpG
MEIFASRNIEVLYLYEPIDEFVMEGIRTYKEYTLKSIEHVDPKDLDKYGDAEQQAAAEPLTDEDAKQFDDFLARVRNILGDRVTEVRVSSRLSSSPSCLVSADGQMTSSMEKILRIVSKDTSIPKKILEVNRDHGLVRNLFTMFKADPKDDYLTVAVEQLFESSLLLEGYLTDPHALVGRIQDILERSSGWYLESRGKD